MPDFERTVLDSLNRIEARITDVELRVQGSSGDPNNQGITGRLKDVDAEIEDINDRQSSLTEDVRQVKEDQGRQKAWLMGMAFGLAVTGGTGIVTLARMIGG